MEELIKIKAAPVLAELGCSLFDVERHGSTLQITITKAGGIDLETLTAASRALSDLLDVLEVGDGRYTLEVSSPGVERRLRTPEHYAGAIGEQVSVKLKPGTGALRRTEGVLEAVDASTATISTPEGATVVLALDDIDRCRTVFSWGPEAAPSPSKAKPKPARTTT